eukprot:CAMPEP_0178524050 /NCGR_PEP_ID=MMETSP0696-20121128/29430_1 /TAXON_ID=265572 /ORGANISM="Extubocellulus spinifer, Strain CCMP396" /LENGTH=406 /DNA_ID=CAMNT_0020155347 /DNA_START=245 /DNA_END=1465 /DNA_ORIENTATION=-
MGIDTSNAGTDVSATRVGAISHTLREEAESARRETQRRARAANNRPSPRPPRPERSSRRIAARKELTGSTNTNQTDQQVPQPHVPASTSPLDTGSISISAPPPDANIDVSPPSNPRSGTLTHAGGTSRCRSSSIARPPPPGTSSSSSDVAWTSAISANDGTDSMKICRIRIFNKSSRTEKDPFGRLCSLWCVENGYIASANRVVPYELLEHPAEAFEFLRGEDAVAIRERCMKSPLFDEKAARYHFHQYRTFASLSQGDIVIMQLSGGRGKGKQAAYDVIFGVIRDNEFIIKPKKEALDDGFPWCMVNPDINPKLDPWKNGLMLRKVHWIRRCPLRELPCQTQGKTAPQVKWIQEASPKFCVEISNSENAMFKDEGFDAMGSQEFLERTVAVDQEWIDHEVAQWSS